MPCPFSVRAVHAFVVLTSVRSRDPRSQTVREGRDVQVMIQRDVGMKGGALACLWAGGALLFSRPSGRAGDDRARRRDEEQYRSYGKVKGIRTLLLSPKCPRRMRVVYLQYYKL